MTTTIDWSDPEAAARLCAGNWRKFECFGWSGRPDDADLWAIFNTHHRDSGLLDQSNAHVIDKEMNKFLEVEDEPDVMSQRHNHWAVGWVDCWVVRVYRPDGSLTDAFRSYCKLKERLEDYPVLDETDYSNREYDAAVKWIEQEGWRHVKDGAPEDWAGQVFSTLWNDCEHESELENTDDTGAAPSEEAIKWALNELGLLDEDED